MLPDGKHGRAADAAGGAGAEVGTGLLGAGAGAGERLLQDADPWILKTAKAGGKEWITQYDQNKDGKVSEDEYTKAEIQKLGKEKEQYAGDVSRHLMTGDTNNDNKLTMNELSKKVGAKAANSLMKEGDTNHDGFLDFGEANKLFGKQFDAREKENLHWQFREFDRDGSGVATTNEAIKTVEDRLRSPALIIGAGGSIGTDAPTQGPATGPGGVPGAMHAGAQPSRDAAPAPREH